MIAKMIILLQKLQEWLNSEEAKMHGLEELTILHRVWARNESRFYER